MCKDTKRQDPTRADYIRVQPSLFHALSSLLPPYSHVHIFGTDPPEKLLSTEDCRKF